MIFNKTPSHIFVSGEIYYFVTDSKREHPYICYRIKKDAVDFARQDADGSIDFVWMKLDGAVKVFTSFSRV